ncbi:hypothetical protein BH23BAC4_BH23BAC4_04170 [soil metagenome]
MEVAASADGSTPRQFPCENCGAQLKFEPGTTALVCPYCQAENEIEASGPAVEERDFKEALALLQSREATVEVLTVQCTNCGAQTDFESNVSGEKCAFCGSSIVAESHTCQVIRPEALLPFRVTDREARDKFERWLKKLWFAPNDLKQYARREGRLSGIYIPHWTFDARTETDYRGQRGTYYYVTQTYTTSQNGRPVTRTRQVRKTRWRSTSGHVTNMFDDVLVLGSTSLPPSYRPEYPPEELKSLVPYESAYLSGFRTETYTIDLEGGFRAACQIMDGVVNQSIRRDIGGDDQRITWTHTDYNDVTFKHILLPVWISTYRYRDKPYRFVVNARTGAVQGERPYSKIKIALAVLATLIVAFLLFLLLGDSGGAVDAADMLYDYY